MNTNYYRFRAHGHEWHWVDDGTKSPEVTITCADVLTDRETRKPYNQGLVNRSEIETSVFLGGSIFTVYFSSFKPIL